MKCMDAGDRTRRRVAAGVLVGTIALVPLLAPATGQAAKAKAGPEVKSCKRLEGAAKRSCARGNAANRTVFLQLRDSQLVGARGDGEEVDWTFCANGRTDMSTSGAGGTGISRGTDWKVEDARVRNGGRSWEAAITDSEGMEIGVLRRGSQWQVAIASLGRFIDPGDVVRTSAKAKCAGA